MGGIFGNTFDFDRDGKLDGHEREMDLIMFMQMIDRAHKRRTEPPEVFPEVFPAEPCGTFMTRIQNALAHFGVGLEKQALKAAKKYLDSSAFSYSGLIRLLKCEKFTPEQAAYGADRCGADWNEQAVKKGKDYLDLMSFSCQGLIDQLIFEGFTPEQATYGAEQNGL